MDGSRSVVDTDDDGFVLLRRNVMKSTQKKCFAPNQSQLQVGYTRLGVELSWYIQLSGHVNISKGWFSLRGSSDCTLI